MTKATARLYNKNGTTIALCLDTVSAIKKAFRDNPTAVGVRRTTPAAPRDQMHSRSEFK